jgi:hypothetical protein
MFFTNTKCRSSNGGPEEAERHGCSLVRFQPRGPPSYPRLPKNFLHFALMAQSA